MGNREMEEQRKRQAGSINSLTIDFQRYIEYLTIMDFNSNIVILYK